MPTASFPSTSGYQRLRIRFRKQGDLRWISHRDLVRAVERLCRRAGLALRMSEGFHPKPKLSFPSALAVGIESLHEVMELEMVTPVEPEEIRKQLNALAPPGLVITQIEDLQPGRRKARIHSMQYQFPVPEERREQVRQAIARMRETTSLMVHRKGRQKPIDLMADLMSVELRDGNLCFCLRATDQVSPRPRDVLQVLGVADLEQDGQFLTRTQVEVVS